MSGGALEQIAHEQAKRDIIDERRPTAVPDITFSDQLTDNMIVMRFPAERAVFAVDFIPIRRLAWKNLADAFIPDWMDAVARVEAMEFDILAPGHGPLGTKADATAFRQYMRELHDQVVQADRAGKTLAEMQENIRLEAYAKWGNYDKHRKLNIEGMYNQVRLHRSSN